jgi:hypothetical protein
MSQADFSKLAYSIGELANKGPIPRSSIYNQIASGRFRARKIGRRTIILDEDWRTFLAGTPIVEPAKGAATLTAPSPRPPHNTIAKTPAPSTQAKTGTGS